MNNKCHTMGRPVRSELASGGVVFAVCFYVDVNRNANIDVYAKNIYASLYSVHKKYAGSQCVLFSNNEDVLNFYRENLVEFDFIRLIVVERCFFEQGRVSNKFPGCLFLLDCISWQAKEAPPDFSRIIFIDPDVVANCLHEFGEQIIFEKNSEVEFLSIDYPHSQSVNGLSRADIAALGLTDEVVWVGGEFLDIDTVAAGPLVDQIAGAHKKISSSFESFTEEHVLSLALSECSFAAPSSNKICRIWNTFSYNNIQLVRPLEAYPLLHLPAEKRYGLLLCYELIRLGRGARFRVLYSLYESRVVCRISHLLISSIARVLSGIRRPAS